MRRRDGLACAVGLSMLATTATSLPPGFIDQSVGGDWNQAVGITFAPDGRMFVWEKGGRVWNLENGMQSAQPLIDISNEVGDWRDYGLLGFAIDPNFYTNGYIYLLYVVDYHYLTGFGSEDVVHDTIARITRYTCDSADGFQSVINSSRLVLVGETMSTGFPMCHQSHGIGSLAFGEDGTLMASCGDGASYNTVDTGNCPDFPETSCTCLSDGIITPKENVGAFRSQLVDSLDGKVIRIDPATGDGVSSNPFYDGSAPRAPRSRVWAMGLRNPYRMTLRPGTGNANPAAADPGTLYIGDVGWYSWEDLNVCKTGGVNFGWPAFEGLEEFWGYYSTDVPNLDAPNPLFNGTTCQQQYFYFRNLIVQDTLNPTSFPNPCNPGVQIPANTRKFEHTRPAIDWSHGGSARTGIYAGNNAAVINLDDPSSPVPGPYFGGNCSVGGVWYTGTDFPAEYQNTYFHAEYGGGWIRNFVFDANDNPVSVTDFANEYTGAIVDLATNPVDGGLYYISYDLSGCCTVRLISWVLNAPPTAIAQADQNYGPSPLTVNFTGSGSTDPDGDPGDLSYDWDFDDGSAVSHAADPTHIFGIEEDITAIATGFDARVFSFIPPAPTGGGNHDPEVMRDGDFPPVGNNDSSRQYDTFHNDAQGSAEDWVGYTFAASREFRGLTFQEGIHFFDGGWFDSSLRVQVRIAPGVWTDVSGLTITRPYAGNNGVSYETYEMRFNPATGTGVRVIGNPGGSANFISVGELRVLATRQPPLTAPTRFDVTLTVTDALQASNVALIPVYLNDTPPQVTITSPINGSTYPPVGNTEIPLTADIFDAEHGPGELTCTWQTILHHNEHTHPEPFDFNCTTTTLLSPHGGPGDTFFYEITLTVADPLGLSTTQTSFVYPESLGPIPTVSEWGLLVLSLLLLGGGTIFFRRTVERKAPAR